VANLLMPRVARATHPIPSLPPALQPWRADRVAATQPCASASGHAVLDRHLPGGGWPPRALTELLLPHPGIGELRLLAPALAALQLQQRSLMWLDPPALPCAWALSALGLDVRLLVLVRSRPLQHGSARPRQPAADRLWALEHALRSGHLGAALAWLPARLPTDALRRLQLAAQAHDGPVFLLRDAAEGSRASPAPLRLLLAAAGPDRLRVTMLKRRGPPLAAPVDIELPPVLAGPGLARAQRVRPALHGEAQAQPHHPSLARSLETP
jgi:protein ImuA